METENIGSKVGYASQMGHKMLLQKTLSVEMYYSPCCRMLHQSRGEKQFIEKAVSVEA